MPCREETIAVRGRQVRLMRQGSGTPLLYLHDTFCYTWLPLLDHLATRYEVLLPVHPGCAGSENVDGIDSMEDLVFHYLDLCDVLRLERPILLGTSLGGWLAAEWAIRYAHLLRGLILVDALGLHVPQAPTADILRLDPPQTRALLFADPASALAQELVPDQPTPEALPGLLQARQTLAHFAWQFPDNPKLHGYLYRARLPSLIIWGEQDGFIPMAHGHAYQAGMPQSELVVLPQCGHLPAAEQPAACVNTIQTFLARLGP